MATVSNKDSESSEDGKQKDDKGLSDSLKKLPFQIFLFVAGADGKVDKNEFKIFITQIETKQICSSPYSKWLLGQTSDSFTELKGLYDKGELTGNLEQIRTLIADINSKLPAKKALELNQDMERLAVSIAEASGAFLWKPAISEDEKNALQELHHVFLMELKQMK